MAVYERSYRGYRGAITPEWSRFLVIPRYAYQQVFASKMFIVFLVLCFLYPLWCAFTIYVPHNLKILEAFDTEKSLLISAMQIFFPGPFMWVQGSLGFLLVFFVGPPLISTDLRNNGLPLYLSRPFSRAEYVLGKLSVLAILLSAITWIPGLLLFFFESYLMGMQWFVDNLRTAVAIVLVSCLWILVLSLLSLAVSAYVRWKPVARLALIGIIFILPAFGEMANLLLNMNWGAMLNLLEMILVVWYRMIGTAAPLDFPLGGAIVSLLAACALSLLALARKVRAYEVVR